MNAARTPVLAALIWCAALALPSCLRAAELPPAYSTNALVGLSKLRDPDALIGAFASGKSTVRIMVKVAEPLEHQRVAWGNKVSEDAMRTAVRRSHDRVAGRNAGADMRVRRIYQNFAGFSAEVSWNALQRLMRDNEVEGIDIVGESRPHLAQGLPLMNALASRGIYNGSGVAVAIVDTGIDYRHPRMGGGAFPNTKVIGGFDTGDDDSDPLPDGSASDSAAHGTACAGIAAGDLGTFGDYIGGVAPSAKIYALKITQNGDPFQGAFDDDSAAAWDWCVTHRNDDTNNPLKVISHSFGGGRYFAACDVFRSITAAAANSAVAAGITLFVSSGNDGYCDSISHPACLSSAIAVGAVYDASFGSYFPCVSGASCVTRFYDPFGCSSSYYAVDQTLPDKVTSYSNTSGLLGVLAPSSSVYTTDIMGAQGFSVGDYDADFGGTSAACPYAAGAAVVLQSAAKSRIGRFLTPAEVRTKLTLTGDGIFDPKGNITKPRVNLGRAIDSLVNTQLFTVTATLVSESFTPTNRAVDPNEVVGLNVSVRNVGTTDASNILVILVATNGVQLPSAPQIYGTLAANGAAVTRPFTFSASGNCGEYLTNIFIIQSGSSNLARANVSWLLGSVVTRLNQTFDGAKAPSLPNTWTTTSLAGGNWVSSGIRFSTASNSAFAANLETTEDMTLTSPYFLISSPAAELSFAHYFDTEYGFDGGALEISINNGPFTDILDAGGVFKTNGYNFNLDPDFGSPMAGRNAWTGKSTNFITTSVFLPPQAANQNVRLRWRFASDNNIGAGGWNIDSVVVSDRGCGPPPPPRVLYPRQTGNSMAFSYNSFAGQTYITEYKENLSSPNWTVLRTEAGDNSLRSVTNGMGANGRFYRLRVR